MESFLFKSGYQQLKQQAYLQLLLKASRLTFVSRSKEMFTKTLLYDSSLLIAAHVKKIIAINQNHKTLLVSYLLL